MALFEEIGAHAQGAVASERPNLKAEDLNIAMENMSQWACGKMVEGAVCGCTEDAKIEQLVDRVAEMAMPRFITAPARPIQSSFIAESQPHYGGIAPLFRKDVQPIELIHSMGLGFFEGNIVKYVSRWRDKDGIEDLKKARTYLNWLIQEAEGTL